MSTEQYRALDYVFSVQIDGPDAAVRNILGSLLDKGEHSRVDSYALRLPREQDASDAVAVLTSPRSATSSNRPQGLVQQLLAEVLSQALPEDVPGLRGALLAIDGRGILLVGASGGGVTTMTAALLRSGAALVSEQVVVLADHGPRSLPLPIMLAKGSMELLELEVPGDCGCGKYSHPVERFGRVAPDIPPITVAAVIGPEVTGVEPVSRARAMVAILRQSAGQALETLTGAERLGRALAGARCFLTSHDLSAVPTILAASALRPSSVQVVTDEVNGGSITLLGGEAVVVVDGLVHHLDPTATGLWILAAEGLSDAEIADELGASAADVTRGLGHLRGSGIPL